MGDIEKLKALAEKAGSGNWYEAGELRYHCSRSGDTHGLHHDEDRFIAAATPDAVLELIAEVKELRRRAGYWKQRAKSAEGHLYAGDMKAAMRELHKRTAFAGTPWEGLSVSQQAQIESAALAVVGAVNARRDSRHPDDDGDRANG